MVGVRAAVNPNYHSPLVSQKKSNLHVLALFIQQCSHICAPAAKPDWRCVWMENLFVLCLKSYLLVWVCWRRRPWVVTWYLTRPPQAGWSSRLFTALGGGANYRCRAGATPLNSDYSHFVTPGGLQALSFKPVINIHSNLIVCAETTWRPRGVSSQRNRCNGAEQLDASLGLDSGEAGRGRSAPGFCLASVTPSQFQPCFAPT